MIKKILPFLLLIIALAQPSTAAIDLAKSFTFLPSFDAKTKTVKVIIKLAPGVHAYAAGEKIGKPVDLQIVEQNGWKAAQKAIIPQGRIKNLGSLGKSIILEKEFAISSKVILGKGPIIGHLDLQVCTDTSCDRPRQHIIKIETGQK